MGVTETVFTTKDYLGLARSLGGLIESHAAEGDTLGTMAPAVVEAFRAVNLWDIFLPKEAGGQGADLLTFLEVVEEISRADASTGWAYFANMLSATFFASGMGDSAVKDVFGGTGPSRRDVTPEATLEAGTREMPGFGEQMRQISLKFVPTAILSRQTAVLREIEGHAALVINLPGQPKAIAETLEGLKDENGKSIVPGIFAAVPYCIDLIGGPYIETNEEVIKAFRPKSAIKK